MALPWYAVHTYSGFELRVKATLEEKVRTGAISKKFGNIIIPQETTEELVRGKKKAVTRKIYPGYIMVQMLIDDETWHLLNNIPKVSGFVGDPRNPLPLSELEVADLLGNLDGTTVSKSKSRKNFEEGDQVKVIDGPFAEFSATVESVNLDKSKLKVLISIFGRNTPVELDFNQVEKV
ncbi:MAG: transcription termination/antitermination protein NusG [Deltaproteobacteria bacterium]|nr:transcription termination/antitermination protein NusG [Deltaproteobacteria bacterium]